MIIQSVPENLFVVGWIYGRIQPTEGVFAEVNVLIWVGEEKGEKLHRVAFNFYHFYPVCHIFNVLHVYFVCFVFSLSNIWMINRWQNTARGTTNPQFDSPNISVSLSRQESVDSSIGNLLSLTDSVNEHTFDFGTYGHPLDIKRLPWTWRLSLIMLTILLLWKYWQFQTLSTIFYNFGDFNNLWHFF